MNRSKLAILAAAMLLLCACAKAPESTPEPAPQAVTETPVQQKNGLLREGDALTAYVDGQPQTFQPGVQEIEGKPYLILEDGTICAETGAHGNYWLEQDSSLRFFEAGFADLPQGTVYNKTAGYALDLYSGTLAEIDGVLCAFDEAGLLMSLEPGTHPLFGKTYLVTEAGIQLPQPGMYYENGSLYHVLEDGTLLTDGDVGSLHFGPDGRYTSGDETLDAAVTALLDACGDQPDSETLLRAAYAHLRDNYRYLSMDLYEAGTTHWAMDSAKTFFEKGKGNCYCWAAAFMYCARQLGYEAYVVAGWESNPDNVHAWAMIDWPDGQTYLFDPQLEYAYYYMFSNKPQIDMFKAPGDGHTYNGFAYYFPE